MFKQLGDLLNYISNTTNVKDVAFHEIKDSKLNPILKTETDHLGIEKWKREHYKNPVYVENDLLVQELISRQTAFVIADTKKDPRSSSEFFFFGIESIAAIPVIREGVVTGVIVVASIGQLKDFSEEEISLCEEAVNRFFIESKSM